MSTVSHFNKKARSIFYIILISGLLSLTSIIIEFVWNHTFIKLFGFERITFLESVGIVAFVYVIYFGIKFGADTETEQEMMHDDDNSELNDNLAFQNATRSNLKPEIIKSLPNDDKKEMLNFVSRCCGMPSPEGPDHSSFRRRIEHING